MSDPSKPKAKVLVVGAGPAGLGAALTLAKNGIPIRFIEKRLTPAVGQRGAGLTARSMEMLDYFGIAEDIAKQWVRLALIWMYKLPEGVEIMKTVEMLPQIPSTPDKPYPNYNCLSQVKIRNFMHQKLKEFGYDIEFGIELRAFDDRGDEGVKATLVHHRDGAEIIEEETFEYIVGADGGKGASRKLLGLSFVGETKVENFIIGDLRIEGLKQEMWHQWGHTGDVLVSLRPTEDKDVYNLILGGTNMKNHADIISTNEKLVNFVMDHSGNRKDWEIKEVQCAGHYIVNIRMTDTYGRGRVWLTGDAAHIHSPFGGQGMNTGLGDSFNLGWKLALIVKGLAPPSLIETYTKERIPVVADMLNLTTYFMNRTAKDNASPDGGWKRTEAIRQFGVNYRSSPIVIDEVATGEQRNTPAYNPDMSGILYAGDRAPDATELYQVGRGKVDPTRIFRILDPSRHTVLLFSDYLIDDAEELYSSIQRYPKELVRPVIITSGSKKSRSSVDSSRFEVFEDMEGYAREVYIKGNENEATGIFVVRPDATIGARLRSGKLVDEYFKGVFGDRVSV